MGKQYEGILTGGPGDLFEDPKPAPPENEFTGDNPLKIYLGEVRALPLLSRKEEVALAKKIEIYGKNIEEIGKIKGMYKNYKKLKKEVINIESKMGKEGTEVKTLIHESEKELLQAKRRLIEANLRLAISIAKRYMGKGLSLSDLIQEGNIGLMKAVDKFDYKKGYKFSTYASWWIRHAITRAIADQGRTIRLPVHTVEAINRITRTSQELMQELGRKPNTEEIAKKARLPLRRVKTVLMACKEPISLEEPIGNEEDSHVGDFVEDKSALSPLNLAIQNDLQNQIQKIMETLTEKEAEVLKRRFGIGDGSSQTLEEIGSNFKVTRERIRQIEREVLKKLKHPKRIEVLKSFQGNT